MSGLWHQAKTKRVTDTKYGIKFRIATIGQRLVQAGTRNTRLPGYLCHTFGAGGNAQRTDEIGGVFNFPPLVEKFLNVFFGFKQFGNIKMSRLHHDSSPHSQSISLARAMSRLCVSLSPPAKSNTIRNTIRLLRTV